MGKVSKAQLKAVRNYEKKTYKRYTINLRLAEDAEIINSIEQAKSENISLRDWLVNLYNSRPQ